MTNHDRISLAQGKHLHITDANENDASRYTCKATNEAGELETDFALRVIGKILVVFLSFVTARCYNAMVVLFERWLTQKVGATLQITMIKCEFLPENVVV